MGLRGFTDVSKAAIPGFPNQFTETEISTTHGSLTNESLKNHERFVAVSNILRFPGAKSEGDILDIHAHRDLQKDQGKCAL